MHEPRDYFIAAWVATFGREPTASELRQGIDMMPRDISQDVSAGFVRRQPPSHRQPKVRNFTPIIDPDPERG